MALLELGQVTIRYAPDAPRAVKDFSLTVESGERVGIVGESGSGKSTLAGAITRSLPPRTVVDGTISYQGTNLASLSDSEFRKYRSVEIARIPQDPLASLNPVLRIERQLADVIKAHRSLPKAERTQLIETGLGEVGIPEPAIRKRAFPHELSGGMRQRILIALSLINSPNLLIADEPTTALDVTVQAQIIDLLQRELRNRQMSLILITHDIGVVAELCERIVVMRYGECVEMGATDELMRNPQHPYTRTLFEAASALPIGAQAISADSQDRRADTAVGVGEPL